MEQKKSNEANLESKKTGFFFIGFVMISAVVLMAFNFRQFEAAPMEIVQEDNSLDDDMIYDLVEEEEEEIPEEEEVAPPPPVIEEIEVVEDDEEVEDLDMSAMEEDVEDVPVEDDEPEIVEEAIVEVAEIDPKFRGGEAAMNEWIVSHIEYPQLAIEMGEDGIVYVQFVVNKNGSIEQVKILRGVSDALDAEAKRVVRKMPKWIPGEQAGKKVRVRFTLPIHFRLR